MWELDYKESWVPKNWSFWTEVLEKTLESPLDCKEIQPVHSKGNQSWIFIGRTDVEAESPILWSPDVKSCLIWKDPDAGRLKVGGEGDNRGWDCWMASQTQWTWVWVSSGSWWWTGKPGMLQSMGSQRVGHIWASELNSYKWNREKWYWWTYLQGRNRDRTCGHSGVGESGTNEESESESPWNSPSQNAWVGVHSLLQGIFPTQDQTQVSCIAGRLFTSWATRK